MAAAARRTLRPDAVDDDIPDDRMLIATGFDAEVRSTGDGRGWQRAETDDRPFRERNEFRIIHCSETAKTTFPDLKLRFKGLPLNKSSESCNRLSPEERSALAIETVLRALNSGDERKEVGDIQSL